MGLPGGVGAFQPHWRRNGGRSAQRRGSLADRARLPPPDPDEGFVQEAQELLFSRVSRITVLFLQKNEEERCLPVDRIEVAVAQLSPA